MILLVTMSAWVNENQGSLTDMLYILLVDLQMMNLNTPYIARQ